MADHPKEVPGFPNMHVFAMYVEHLDYAVQAEFFGELAGHYNDRSANDDKFKRSVLAAKGQSIKTLAFTMRDALANMAKLRPKEKKAA